MAEPGRRASGGGGGRVACTQPNTLSGSDDFPALRQKKRHPIGEHEGRTVFLLCVWASQKSPHSSGQGLMLKLGPNYCTASAALSCLRCIHRQARTVGRTCSRPSGVLLEVHLFAGRLCRCPLGPQQLHQQRLQGAGGTGAVGGTRAAVRWNACMRARTRSPPSAPSPPPSQPPKTVSRNVLGAAITTKVAPGSCVSAWLTRCQPGQPTSRPSGPPCSPLFLTSWARHAPSGPSGGQPRPCLRCRWLPRAAPTRCTAPHTCPRCAGSSEP